MVTKNHPDWLRAMTLHFPWAWLICNGYKIEEYRSKTVKHRGLILIHAGQSRESDYVIKEAGIPKDQIVRGAIIGAVEILDSVRDGDWAIHKLDMPLLFDEPIGPVSGQQAQLWSATTPQAIDAFNRAWALLQEDDE